MLIMSWLIISVCGITACCSLPSRDPGSHVENSYLFINITEPDDFKWYYVCYTTLSDVANGQRRIQLTVKGILCAPVYDVVIPECIRIQSAFLAYYEKQIPRLSNGIHQ